MEVAGRTRILLLLSRIKAIAQRKSMESQTELKMPNSPLWLPRFLSYRPETALTTSDVSELNCPICLPQSPQLKTVPSIKWAAWKTKAGLNGLCWGSRGRPHAPR